MADPLVTFVLRHHVVKVTSSVLNPRCRRREQFLVLTSAHCVERLLSSWCGKTQIARIEANRMATKSRAAGQIKYVERQMLTTRVLVLCNTSAVILLLCINVRFNNCSIHNYYDNARHCVLYYYRWCSGVARGGHMGHAPPQTFGECFFPN